MNLSNNARVIKDYEKLDEAIKEQLKLKYPYGFDRHLITFKNIQGKFVSALPFEAEEKYYLVRMTKALAQEIIEEDDDYDEDGNLKDDAKEEYIDKHDSFDDAEDDLEHPVNEEDD